MNLDLTTPVNPVLVTKAVEFVKELPKLDKNADQYFTALIMHWQVGTYENTSEEYNLETYLDDASNEWRFRITQDPRHNAIDLTLGQAAPYAAHTFSRNSHGLGCAVAAMWEATPSNFGPNPVQAHEAEAFFAMCGAAAATYNLDPLDSSQVYTHAEAAIIDNYFPGDGDPDARWDWARTEASDAPLTVEEAFQTAQKMRARINQYKIAILKAV
jgi:hypothetical protein